MRNVIAVIWCEAWNLDLFFPTIT